MGPHGPAAASSRAHSPRSSPPCAPASGWDNGVAQMSLGEKAILAIPAAEGYGARGAGRRIPPDADLVFEVELLQINDQRAPS